MVVGGGGGVGRRAVKGVMMPPIQASHIHVILTKSFIADYGRLFEYM